MADETIIFPIGHDDGERIAEALEAMAGRGAASRVTSLDGTALHQQAPVTVAGVPAYVADVADYEEWGLTEAGWYAFARIAPTDGTVVTAGTTVAGAAGHVAEVGADHVDVAVRFGVAAASQEVTVDWGNGSAETFVFQPTDLAVRNLDYRTTFYIYDLAPFCTWEYKPCEDATFVRLKGYYRLVDGEYVPDPDVVAGDPVPADTYHVHSKLTLAGMVRNVTYELGTIIDCPVTVELPDIPDDGYGAWYEFQLRHQGSYSMTLSPASGDVKAATDATGSQTTGINIIDLHYASVAGKKVWRLVNTHSTATDVPASLEFRTPPTKVEYAAGENLDLTGAEVVATYMDGSRQLAPAGLTYSPASGAALTTDVTELVATLTSAGATVTASVPLTVTEGE